MLCIRKRNGIPPAPERSKNTTWRQFLKAHWEGLIAADFFTTEVLCWKGLITFYTLFVIELRSRLVQVCGTTVSPNGQWMTQVARQLTDGMDGFAGGKTHLTKSAPRAERKTLSRVPDTTEKSISTLTRTASRSVRRRIVRCRADAQPGRARAADPLARSTTC